MEKEKEMKRLEKQAAQQARERGEVLNTELNLLNQRVQEKCSMVSDQEKEEIIQSFHRLRTYSAEINDILDMLLE